MNRGRLIAAAAAILAFGRVLWSESFLRDDLLIISGNPLLRSAGNIWTLLVSGYWESAVGPLAPVALYRPVVLISHWIDVRLFTGPGPMHLLNVLGHGAASLLVAVLMRRLRHSEAAAFWTALYFAVLPIHTEPVATLVNRSEILAAIGILAAWIFAADPAKTDLPRLSASFAGALLSKEHAVLFPALLAMSDWQHHGLLPTHEKRRRVYAALGAVLAAYLAVRFAVFDEPFRGGAPYFAETPAVSRVLTTARFWLARYLWPMASGLGLADDFSRPLIADASAADPAAWGAFLIISAALAAGAVWLRRRAAAGFWILFFPLFLLPTAHLLPFCAIGAQRFLYLPSLAWAAALGLLTARASGRRRTAGAAIAAIYACFSLARTGDYLSDIAYYESVTGANPYSYDAKIGLANALLRRGRQTEGYQLLLEAVRINPRAPLAYYNLGRLAWERGDAKEARAQLRRALELSPGEPDALSLLAAVEEAAGREAEAEKLYLQALGAQPLHNAALFNVGRLYWKQKRIDEARMRLARFAAAYPGDPAAGWIASVLEVQRPAERK